MGADETVNPMVVTGAIVAATKITDKQTYLKFVRWYKPTTIGHLLSLIDKEGKVITKGYCDTADVSQDIPVFTLFDNIYIDDMDSGTLYLYRR